MFYYLFMFCKLQLGCFLILLYISIIYFREKLASKNGKKAVIFDLLLAISIIEVTFDGITAYTVNVRTAVSQTANMIYHLFFLLSIDAFIFLLSLYMIVSSRGLPKSPVWRTVIFAPFVVNVVIVCAFIPKLQYLHGTLTGYSMGISAYTCFIMAAIYILFTLILLIRRWRDISRASRFYVFTYMIVLSGITVFQMIYPQVLLSSLCVTIVVLGIYINQENPSVRKLETYREEMIMGFATLVENKDGETGGHIRRTTGYVRLLALELRNAGMYRDILTKDYIDNLCLAAPMHDIGKISMPDSILKKPEGLTDEEFEEMKTHTTVGGEIIRDTFGHLDDTEYAKIAYDVARYHHEKWDGSGYPTGSSGNDIPLSARIMAIADVFDAVAESRRYRIAMSMDECFDIIRQGSGTQFDPVLVGHFLNIRDKVEAVHTAYAAD